MAEKSASRRPIVGKPTPSIALHCDNMAAISVAISKVFNGKRRHIRLRHKVGEGATGKWSDITGFCEVRKESSKAANERPVKKNCL